MDPRDVRPKGIEVVELLYDTGEGEDTWSIARLRDPHSRRMWLGMRWNGKPGEKGYPTARGYPCWMALPDPMAQMVETIWKVNKDLFDDGAPLSAAALGKTFLGDRQPG